MILASSACSNNKFGKAFSFVRPPPQEFTSHKLPPLDAPDFLTELPIPEYEQTTTLSTALDQQNVSIAELKQRSDPVANTAEEALLLKLGINNADLAAEDKLAAELQGLVNVSDTILISLTNQQEIVAANIIWEVE